MRVHWFWTIVVFGLGVFLGPSIMGMFGGRRAAG